MRKPIIGGNWKMNRGTPSETKDMLEKFIPLVKAFDFADIVICPPFTALSAASEMLKGTNIKLGAQNMYFEENGAYTGEVSPIFLKALGCEYVILGHSERRNIFYESDELVNKKLKKALEMKLKPIVAIGEHLEEREANRTKERIEQQINDSFQDISKEDMINTVIAYEPIWAIGTGKTATPDQAEEIHVFIREIIEKRYDKEVAEKVRIQYGGSMKPNNAEELLNKKNIDGGLVGGASLDADSFASIIQAAK